MKKAIKSDPGGKTSPLWEDATPFGVGVRPDGFDCLLGFHT